MLIVERNVTLPSENIRRQISSIVNNFIYNNIEKKAKLNDWNINKIKSNLSKQIKNNNNYIFLGNVKTKEKISNKNLSIDIFIVSDDFLISDDAIYTHNPNEDDDSYGQVQIKFSLLFGDQQVLLNKIIHELIHGIQKFKTKSKKYIDIIQKVDLRPIDWFLYFTEQHEFEAQIGELFYNITEKIKKSKKPLTNLYVLKKILLMPKEKLKNINSWYNDNDPYMKEMFSYNLWFIESILNPPEIQINKSIKTREDKFLNKRLKLKSEKCYKFFKQKMFNIYEKSNQYIRKKIKEKNK